MRTIRLSPAAPPGGRAPRRSGWGAGLSVLLHVAALLALLLLTRRAPVDQQMAPSYDLVFEGTGGSVPSTAPDKGESQPRSEQSQPAEEVPSRSEPNTAPATPTPSEALPEPASPPPAPMPEVAVPATPEPAPVPEPAAPRPTPSQPEQPRSESPAEVRLQPPDLPAPLAPAVPELDLPAPPMAPVPPQAPPLPRATAPAMPRRAPPAAPGSFANPMDLSFNQTPRRGERLPPPRSGAAAGSVASRSMDFSLGAPKPGPNRSEAFFDARARNLGADWMQGVKAFWLRHRYYPPQAAENGEEGTLALELTVDRTGRVQSAVVTSRSGSAWLDMAAVGTFRGAQLPPIPVEVDAPFKTTLDIHYMIIR